MPLGLWVWYNGSTYIFRRYDWINRFNFSWRYIWMMNCFVSNLYYNAVFPITSVCCLKYVAGITSIFYVWISQLSQSGTAIYNCLWKSTRILEKDLDFYLLSIWWSFQYDFYVHKLRHTGYVRISSSCNTSWNWSYMYCTFIQRNSFLPPFNKLGKFIVWELW